MQRSNPEKIIISKKLKRHHIQHSHRRRNSDKSSNREYFNVKLKELDVRYRTLRNKYVTMLREKDWLEGNVKFVELCGNLLKAFENQFRYSACKSNNASISEMKEQIREWTTYLDIAEKSYAEVEKLRYSQANISTIWTGWSFGSLSCLNDSEEIKKENSKLNPIVANHESFKQNFYGELPSLNQIFEKKIENVKNENVEKKISFVTGLEQAKIQLENAEIPPLSSIVDDAQQEELKSDRYSKQLTQAELRIALNLFKKDWSYQPKRKEKKHPALFAPDQAFFKFDEIRDITIEIIDPTLARRKTL